MLVTCYKHLQTITNPSQTLHLHSQSSITMINQVLNAQLQNHFAICSRNLLGLLPSARTTPVCLPQLLRLLQLLSELVVLFGQLPRWTMGKTGVLKSLPVFVMPGDKNQLTKGVHG